MAECGLRSRERAVAWARVARDALESQRRILSRSRSRRRRASGSIYDRLDELLRRASPTSCSTSRRIRRRYEISHARAAAAGCQRHRRKRLDATNSARRLTRMRAEAGVGAMLVPNFSLGAVLMMRFAQEAARFFPDAEIVEMHHAGKKDAPSGTAR